MRVIAGRNRPIVDRFVYVRVGRAWALFSRTGWRVRCGARGWEADGA